MLMFKSTHQRKLRDQQEERDRQDRKYSFYESKIKYENLYDSHSRALSKVQGLENEVVYLRSKLVEFLNEKYEPLTECEYQGVFYIVDYVDEEGVHLYLSEDYTEMPLGVVDRKICIERDFERLRKMNKDA